MWGFFNERSRSLAKYFYDILTSRLVTSWYRSYSSERGQDQYILNWYFWGYAKRNSTIHDSYTCDKFGGKAFPTQRPLYKECYVGGIGCCQNNTSLFKFVCPSQCRPPEHKLEWLYC